MKYVISLVLYLYSYHMTAQRFDNIWCMGYESNGDSTTEFGGQNIDFRYDPPKIFYRNREAYFDTTSGSICDSVGNLLFYTNGCKIYNADDEIIEGGDSLTSMDNYWTQEFWCPYGFTAPQGVLILPDPYNENEYYLFHQDVNIYPDFYPKIDELYMTKINMNLNNQKGRVISKRNLILNKLMSFGSISAVKHSNGRDWWFMISSLEETVLNTFLISDNGCNLIHEQNIGALLDNKEFGWSAKFSPDGKTYSRFHLLHGLEIFDFDRKTGLFSNPRLLPFWEVLIPGKQLGDGLEYSPDSRKLYVDYNTALFQFDLSANDVFGSLQLIDTLHIDTTEFYRPSFYQMQLAPNGKIYMAHLNGTKYLHIIHNPNEKGQACDFRQRDFRLKTWNAFTMPYFPNFRLGPDTTVSVPKLDPTERIYIYPNPTQTTLCLSGMDRYEGKWIWIYDSQGRIVRSEVLKSNMIDISLLPNGMYFLKIRTSTEKFVKIE